MSHKDFEAYKHSFEDVNFSFTPNWEHTGEKAHWIWPALIITVVTIQGTEFSCHHTSLPKKELLYLLGLSQEELKIEFNNKDIQTELTPETFEQREI
jgi:hypothetical protein